MNAHRIYADLLFTNAGVPMRGAVIELDADGVIMDVLQGSTPGEGDVHVSVAAPGFVNAHCHLELSQLKGSIDGDARGMTHFIRNMMDLRQSRAAWTGNSFMEEADQCMWEEGVVAVGDISNTRVSAPLKASSLIRYHTFVEVMGLSDERADAIWNDGDELRIEFESLAGRGRASITPHALYSVSARLMEKILSNHPSEAPLSIHMQESLDELDYCRDKSGPFAELFEESRIPDSGFVPYGDASPLLSLLAKVPAGLRLQTVHNTFTSAYEIRKAIGMCSNLYWCLCPSANLFITGQLPDVPGLLAAGALVTVGTDSLASNDRLSMVKELIVMQENFPALPTEDLLKWASLHGAQFLGLDNEFGSIARGKRPGLVVLENMNPDNPRFHKGVKARKLNQV